MAVQIEGLAGCCAVDEIINLSDAGGARNALITIIKNYYSSSFSKEMYDPGAFIIFTSVERLAKGSKGDCPIGYGSEFAAYIRKNRLGVVTKSPARMNRNNHPDHSVVVWVWAPSYKNLKKWWKENYKK